jgi:hypothetical protein
MLWESVKIVMLLLFGIAASAVIMPQSSKQNLLEGPGGRGKEYLVSSMSGLIVKFRFGLLFSLSCPLFIFFLSFPKDFLFMLSVLFFFF